MRNGHWMMTYTGRPYWPSDPHPDDVSIVDIAHHLSMLCRYTGASHQFYSVAEHSVHVSFLVPPKLALVGLLHDAPEAYLNDISRPVKAGIGLAGYRDLETRNWLAIARKFNLPEEEPAEVKRADSDMLFHERTRVLPYDIPEGLDWGMGLEPPAEIRPGIVQFWSQPEAKMHFLARFAHLTQARDTGSMRRHMPSDDGSNFTEGW